LSGLYRKALDYLQSGSHLRLVTPDEVEHEEQQISAEDQKTITAQIEKVLEENKMRIDDDTFKVTAERRGGFLPVLVNIVAALLVAAGFFAALYYFDRQEQEVSLGRQAIESAESRLLDTMALESEERLTAKNDEISSIQRELATMISERQSIKTSAEETIRVREEELQAELERQLEAERVRLGQDGLSSEAVAERMADFQARLEDGFESQLQEAVADANRELVEQENTLNSLISEYEDSLQSAETERAELAQALETRRAELEAALAQSESELAGERAKFDNELQSMRDQQASERFVLDQLLVSYAGIENDISIGRLDSARERIGALRSYLDDVELTQLPMMRNRRPVELFIVDALESLVEYEFEDQSVDTASLIASANVIASIVSLVEAGDVLANRGDYAGARAKYVESFNKIPALSDGYQGVQEIDTQLRRLELSAVEDLVARADLEFLAGDYQRAIDLYSQAVRSISDEGALNAELIERVSEAGYLLRRPVDLSALASADAAYAALEDSLASAETAYAALEIKLASADAAYASLETRLASTDAAYASLETKLASAEDSSATTDAQLRSTQESSDATEAELQSVRAELALVEAKLVANETALSASEANLQSTEDDLVDALEREATLDALRTQQAKLVSDMDDQILRLRELQDQQMVEVDVVIQTLRADLTRTEREIDRLEEFESLASERERTAESVATYSSRYADAIAASSGGQPETPDDLNVLGLLQTKLAIVTVIGSESVQNEYPGLVGKLDEYLAALIENNTVSTQEATLSEVINLLDRLNENPGSLAFQSPSQAGDELSGQFAEFLEKLTLLLR
jgi:DNA repair exonuclease SbcCD ATPase subunit